jgi:catechol 2,3-dioxygenase-like lactoylglutathione lyase family enzyme
MKFRVLISVATAAVLTACGLGGGEPEPIEPDTVILGINYVGISVSDLDAAEDLYVSSVDGEVINEDALPFDGVLASLAQRGGGEIEARLIRRTNSQIRLMSFPDRPADVQAVPAVPVEGPGIAHVCFQVADETDTYDRFLAAGATHIGDENLVHLRPNNPVKYGYVKDSDGIITEIEQIDLAKLELPKPPKSLYRTRHVSLSTPNVNRLKDFYSAFLGGQTPRHVGRVLKVSGDTIDAVSGLEGSKIEMAWVQTRNLEIEMFQYHSHPTEISVEPRPLDAVGYNMIVFDVSDIEAARERVLDAGGTIVSDLGQMDGGNILFARDPDGNLLGLQTLPEDSVFSAANFPDNGT